VNDDPKSDEKTEVVNENHQSKTTREQNGNEDDDPNQQISKFRARCTIPIITNKGPSKSALSNPVAIRLLIVAR
jgi:hypothetical protein